MSIVFWRAFDKAVRGKPPSVAAAQTMEHILWPAEGWHFAFAHNQLGQAYLQKRMNVEASAEMEKAVHLSSGSPTCIANLASAYVASGRKSEAIKLVNDLKQGSNRSDSHASEIAVVYAALGDKDRAMNWLEKGY